MVQSIVSAESTLSFTVSGSNSISTQLNPNIGLCSTDAQKSRMFCPARWHKPGWQRGEAPRCPRWIPLVMHWQVQQYIQKVPPVVQIFQSSLIGKREPRAYESLDLLKRVERSFLPRWHSDAARNTARSPSLCLRSAARMQSGGRRAPLFHCSFVPLVSRLKWPTRLQARKRRAHKSRKLLQVHRQRHYPRLHSMPYKLRESGSLSVPCVWHNWRKKNWVDRRFDKSKVARSYLQIIQPYKKKT